MWGRLASRLKFVLLCVAECVSVLTIKQASPLPEAAEWNKAPSRMAYEDVECDNRRFDTGKNLFRGNCHGRRRRGSQDANRTGSMPVYSRPSV